MGSRVLVVLKPDCLNRKLEALAMSLILESGLVIERRIIKRLDDRLLSEIYRPLVSEHFYKDLAAFMKSGPCMILLVSGTDAVAGMNRLKHEFRKDHQEYWIDLTIEDLELWGANRHPNQTALNIKLVAANLMHVCDSEEESIRCAKLIFDA